MGCVSSKNDDSAGGGAGGGARAPPPPPPAAAAGGGKGPGAGAAADGAGGGQQLDKRLPFTNYRDAYSLKNYWKTVRRKENFGKYLLLRFLRDFPDHKAKFALLCQANLDDESKLFDNGEFEKVATNYFHVFDELMTEIENNAGNMDNAVDTLTGVGKKNKRSPEFTLESYKAMEEPFLSNVRDVLEDRYNEKCETLFRGFFKFCIKYIEEGYQGG